MDATHALFERLIDYAGLFPPAQLDMAPAVEEFGVLRKGPWAWMAGRFIVPASRTFELCEELEDLDFRGDPYALSVIIDAGADPRAWLGEASNRLASVAKLQAEGLPVRIEALEVPVPPIQAARDTYDSVIGQFGMLAQNAGLRDLPTYIEIPRTDGWQRVLPGAMAAIARGKFGAKLRCGGVAASAFPSSEEVAAFISAAFEHDVAFKATAGLHHPVRHPDAATGFVMHGFLNVLAAAIFVRDGAGAAELAEMLEERDERAFGLGADTFTWRARAASLHQIEITRAGGFVSYGSCSFEEPVQDLIALHMLAPANVNA